MNAQYITNKGFARYMVKYIAKRESSHVFNIHENDLLREHVIARCLGSMELMFLLLGHSICNSSVTVKFITTELPPTRSRTILPIYMLDEDEENPYYDDTIMKYLARPRNPDFENLTYPQYYEQYSITPSHPQTTSRQVFCDELNNYVVKRAKEILVRYRFLKIDDGELYFYQKLLLTIPARNESDYITPGGTYREKFLSLFPNFLTDFQNNITNSHQTQVFRFNTQFSEMLARLLQSLHQQLPTNLSRIVEIQMESLKILPQVFPETAMLELPQDQYHVLSAISMYMGKNDGVKWPYYFITGSGGTSKSYIINLIINMLAQRRSNYLLLAPT